MLKKNLAKKRSMADVYIFALELSYLYLSNTSRVVQAL